MTSKSRMPTAVKPMLSTLVKEPFDSNDWIYELKWDGYRALAEIKDGKTHLYSRNFQSFDSRFHPLLEELNRIPGEALIDGEVVVIDKEGKPSFQLMQNYGSTQEGMLVYYVFDLLYLNGYDIRALPLLQRKELLKAFLPKLPHVKFCPYIIGKGIDYFKEAAKRGFEGIMAKKAESSYHSIRSKDWLKIKTNMRQEAIICGYTAPKGGRKGFGALVLGVYENGDLVYIGHTGSGFNEKSLKSIYEQLQPYVQNDCPFTNRPKLKNKTTWVKPKIVCEVKFAEWTNTGIIRQGIFMGLRDDKKSKNVIREPILPTKKAVKVA
ncbi:MAG: non-homologous end-joining DNA ligase, partial [Holosporales bacterium]|nr:non-homologous end-joining DNA ligase [Holosporales bacterium]